MKAQMTWEDLVGHITEIISKAAHLPQAWIRRNEVGIRKYARYPGPTIFFAALQQCIDDGGKLYYFIPDFNMWKVKSRAAKPLRKESDKEYFARHGQIATMAKPLEKIELTPDEEKAIEQHFDYLKKKFREKAM
jgi:hypothetical protein